jgi:hypothetical protein
MQNNNNNNDLFDARVEGLRNNTAGPDFELCSFRGRLQPRWPLLEANELLSALKDNTTVETIYIEPGYFPVAAIQPLLDYVQSNPHLQDVTVFNNLGTCSDN